MTRAEHLLLLAEELMEGELTLDPETEKIIRGVDEGFYHAVKSLFKGDEPEEKESGENVKYDWRSPSTSDTGIYHYALLKSGDDLPRAISYLSRIKANFEREAKENPSMKKVLANIEKALDKLEGDKSARLLRYSTGGSFTHGHAAAHA